MSDSIHPRTPAPLRSKRLVRISTAEPGVESTALTDHPASPSPPPLPDTPSELADEPITSITGEFPVWELQTLPVPAPRPMPVVAPSSQKAPLEIMLKQLRVHRPKPMALLRTTFRSALESIWSNRLRSLLATLSIFISVTAMILAVILVRGVTTYFTDAIANIGESSIVIDAGTYSTGWMTAERSVQSLTPQDLQVLTRMQYVKTISPIINVEQEVGYGMHSWLKQVQGVSVSLLQLQQWEVQHGLWFSETDDLATRPVVVLGSTIARDLLGEQDAVGKQILIGTTSYRVIGVLAPRGGFALDERIFIPYNTALARLDNANGIDRIEIKLDDERNLYFALHAINYTLRKNHHIPGGSPNDFQINEASVLIQQAEQEMQAVTTLLLGTATILQFAGGIGIMNMMLASVAQRTREIGVRMAVGARQRDICHQFLLEALVLCLIGGGAGLLAGLLIGIGIRASSGFPTAMTAILLVIPFAVSTLIAVVFGLYPALWAARLDPAVALQRSAK
jgi:ABC-type antimicrobial peptide transport system permease subunit